MRQRNQNTSLKLVMLFDWRKQIPLAGIKLLPLIIDSGSDHHYHAAPVAEQGKQNTPCFSAEVVAS